MTQQLLASYAISPVQRILASDEIVYIYGDRYAILYDKPASKGRYTLNLFDPVKENPLTSLTIAPAKKPKDRIPVMGFFPNRKQAEDALGQIMMLRFDDGNDNLWAEISAIYNQYTTEVK